MFALRLDCVGCVSPSGVGYRNLLLLFPKRGSHDQLPSPQYCKLLKYLYAAWLAIATILLLCFSAKCALTKIKICRKASSSDNGFSPLAASAHTIGFTSRIKTRRLESSGSMIIQHIVSNYFSCDFPYLRLSTRLSFEVCCLYLSTRTLPLIKTKVLQKLPF